MNLPQFRAKVGKSSPNLAMFLNSRQNVRESVELTHVHVLT